MTSIRIKKIVLVTGFMTDRLSLETEDLPDSFGLGERARLNMDVVYGQGREYVAKYFDGVPLEVIDTRKGVVSKSP